MPIRPGAQAWSFDGEEPTGVLLIHGFTGSPASMRPWGEALAQHGWSVRVPRLPGHGTRWQDMNITTWEDWYSEADRNVRQLLERCSAEQHGEAIAGIVLVNPAVHTERKDRHLLPVVKHLVGSFPGISNDIAKPGMDEVAYDRTPLKAAHSMMTMWSLVRDDIALVRQPLLLFRSTRDNVVEASNAEWILTHVASTDTEEVVLAKSLHVATLDHDSDTIVDGSVRFIQRLA